MAQQITSWICHGEGEKRKRQLGRGESQVFLPIPKSGSVALCPCFRNYFQLKRGIHVCFQGQDGLGATWSSSRSEKGSGWNKMVLRSLPTHPAPHPLALNTHPASPPQPISLHPWDGSILLYVRHGQNLSRLFFCPPQPGHNYKHHRYPPIKISVQDWGLSGSGLVWIPWISVNLLIITFSRFSFIPWRLLLFLDSLGLSAIFH